MILLVDNYDSFVFNLARYFERLGQETLVVRNDATRSTRCWRSRPQAVVLSPGPCSPAEAGCSLEVVRQLHDRLPILGVCLGHQAIGQALGGRVVRAAEPVHGRARRFITRPGNFCRPARPALGCRYHSLVVEQLAARLFEDGLDRRRDVMAIEHRERPMVGIQFHPESILTDCWLSAAGGVPAPCRRAAARRAAHDRRRAGRAGRAGIRTAHAAGDVLERQTAEGRRQKDEGGRMKDEMGTRKSAETNTERQMKKH